MLGVGEPLAEHVVGEEVLLDELAEAAPDLVLASRDDRGVRDRDAERMPEQRGHGEPIGERTDHRRLRRGDHVADPRGITVGGVGNQEHDGCGDEHPRRDDLHPPESGCAIGVGQRGRHAGATLPPASDRAGDSIWQASPMTQYTEIVGGLEFPEGPIAMPDGTVVLVEMFGERLTRVHPDGTTTTVAEVPGGPNGAAVGPDGAIYVCNNGGARDPGRVRRQGAARAGSIRRATSAVGSSASIPGPAPSPTCTPNATAARCVHRTTW